MKKILGLVLMFSFSTTAFAAEKTTTTTKTTVTKTNKRKIASEEIKCSATPDQGIGIDPEYIQKQVAKAESCYEASNIVENCGAGSSMDVGTAGSAADVCDKFTGKLSKSDESLKKLMLDRCTKVCDPKEDGTMCQSQQAFCRLSVSKFLNSVNVH